MHTVALITWRFLLVAAVCASAYLALPGQTHACSCVERESVAEALANSDKVFAGRVISITDMPSYRLAVQFEATTIWKGPVSRLISVEEPPTNNSCHYGLRAGAEYLVYSRDGQVHYCTRTKVLSEAQADLDELGQGQALVSAESGGASEEAQTPPPGESDEPVEPDTAGGCGASVVRDGAWLGLAVGLTLVATRRRR